jgi:hypothetical protein
MGKRPSLHVSKPFLISHALVLYRVRIHGIKSSYLLTSKADGGVSFDGCGAHGVMIAGFNLQSFYRPLFFTLDLSL